MARINVLKVLSETKGTINRYYDATIDDIRAIKRKNDADLFGSMCDSFVFGYAQGMKAAKTEMKKTIS